MKQRAERENGQIPRKIKERGKKSEKKGRGKRGKEKDHNRRQIGQIGQKK
jgi:hypothetical protein